MNCRRARMAVIERDSGSLAAPAARMLESHLERCPVCRGELEAESRLVAELSGLRLVAIENLDVMDRVLGRLAQLTPASRDEARPRQIGWASAAAVTVGLLMLTALFVDLARSSFTLEHAGELLAIAGQLVLLSARVVLAFVVIALKLLLTIVNSLKTLQPLLGALQPTAAAILAIGCMVMLATLTTVIGRDFRSVTASPSSSRKES